MIVLDRNAIESNFKTLGTSQSHDIRGLPRVNEPELAGRLKMRAIAMKQPELKGQNKMNFGTAKAGGEFEEAVVVPKGALPLRGTMVGFWVNPKSELMKDPSIMNDPRRLDMVRPNQFTKATQTQGVAEGAEEINWIKPNFDYEWDEIEFQSKQPQVPADVRNYMAKHFPDKQAWMKSVQYGRPVVMRPDHGQKIRNYTDNKRDLLNALSPASHDPQGPAKAKRVNALFDKGGPIEMPIILQTEKGLWLIGGKTRLGTANLLKGIPAKVWIIGGKQGVAEVSKTTVVENADQAAVDALLKKHGWSTGITGYGDLYFTWQGSTYVFYGDRMRINWPNGKSVSVVWGQKPDWQTRPGELSFAQAVQQKLLTFDLPIWQQLDRGQINDSQALQKFKTENERQAREAIAQGVTESAGPVEAYGYVYDRRDQRVMWRKVFPSEQAAQTWADSKNATVLGMKPVSQNIAEDYIDEKN